MKVRVTFKTPDALDYALEEAGFKNNENLDCPEEDLDKWEAAKKTISKWIKYGEVVTIEFDLDAKTARVVEA